MGYAESMDARLKEIREQTPQRPISMADAEEVGQTNFLLSVIDSMKEESEGKSALCKAYLDKIIEYNSKVEELEAANKELRKKGDE